MCNHFSEVSPVSSYLRVVLETLDTEDYQPLVINTNLHIQTPTDLPRLKLQSDPHIHHSESGESPRENIENRKRKVCHLKGKPRVNPR